MYTVAMGTLLHVSARCLLVRNHPLEIRLTPSNFLRGLCVGRQIANKAIAEFISFLCSGDRSCGPAAAIQDSVHQEPDH